ncbi:LytR/AlgR family response regulator transcription factor [Holdemanella biformis]|uniref:LytR/AlgR family response regulator transcription factor n=1 Tax=Holdemanella biformis TaxID=1735 RepID=UPI001C37F1AD|nr:LytTR family DNA-binding domain-containing protein [Holdemanella biformis]MBV4131505.1 LytTR family DNA-binding domain-containing protein [Holdemanella biformis]MBV4151257.1 LytTR family DNA-binding domain-containing protein [Holdemanella biformis]
MRIAVLEDSLIQQKRIRNLLDLNHRLCFFCTVEEYMESNFYYDLLLLDIELGSQNGIEFIKKHPDKQRFIVYVSSHNETMADTFDTNVLGFVTKNRIEEALVKKVNQVEQRIHQLEKIALNLPYETRYVYRDDILYFQIDNGIFVLLKDGTKLSLVNETLKEIEATLSDSFVRVNNNVLINFSKADYLDVKNHKIIMLDGTIISVSVRRWKKVKEHYIQMRTSI